MSKLTRPQCVGMTLLVLGLLASLAVMALGLFLFSNQTMLQWGLGGFFFFGFTCQMAAALLGLQQGGGSSVLMASA